MRFSRLSREPICSRKCFVCIFFFTLEKKIMEAVLKRAVSFVVCLFFVLFSTPVENKKALKNQCFKCFCFLFGCLLVPSKGASLIL